jgi:hypothetical protein
VIVTTSEEKERQRALGADAVVPFGSGSKQSRRCFCQDPSEPEGDDPMNATVLEQHTDPLRVVMIASLRRRPALRAAAGDLTRAAGHRPWIPDPGLGHGIGPHGDEDAGLRRKNVPLLQALCEHGRYGTRASDPLLVRLHPDRRCLPPLGNECLQMSKVSAGSWEQTPGGPGIASGSFGP